jgi:MULE transposase domain
MKKGVR